MDDFTYLPNHFGNRLTIVIRELHLTCLAQRGVFENARAPFNTIAFKHINVILQLPFVCLFHLVRLLDLVYHLSLCIEVIHLHSVYLHLLIAFAALGIRRLVNQLSFIYCVGSRFHIDAIGKQPQFAMTYLIIIEVSARYLHLEIIGGRDIYRLVPTYKIYLLVELFGFSEQLHRIHHF